MRLKQPPGATVSISRFLILVVHGDETLGYVSLIGQARAA